MSRRQRQIEACEARVNADLDKLAREGERPDDKGTRKGRDGELRRWLRRMLGADMIAIPTVGVGTAPTVAAEIGADLSRFASTKHFCSWLGLAPGTRFSRDRRLGFPPTRRANRVGQVLLTAAHLLIR